MENLNLSKLLKFLGFLLILEFLVTEGPKCQPLSAKELFDDKIDGVQIMRISTIKASSLTYRITELQKKKNLIGLSPEIRAVTEEELLNELNNGLNNYWNSVHLFACGLREKIIRINDGDTTNPIEWVGDGNTHYGLIAIKNKSEESQGKILLSFQGSPGGPNDSPAAWKANLSSEWINLENFHPEEDELKYARCFFSNGYQSANEKFKSPKHYVMTKHHIKTKPGVIIEKFYMNKNSQEHYRIKGDKALEVPDDTLEKAHIHRGFFQTSLSAQEEIFELLRSKYADLLSDPGTDYILTGHSLGAASTTVFAAPLHAFLKESNGNKDPSLNIINYGSPRVFNTTAGRLFNEQIGVNHILRVINNDDSWKFNWRSDPITWVPKFPLSSYLRHVKTLGVSFLTDDCYMHVGTTNFLYNIPKYGIDLHKESTYLEYVLK